MKFNVDLRALPKVFLTMKRQIKNVQLTGLTRKMLLFISLIFVCFIESYPILAQDGNLIEVSGQVYESLKSAPLPDVSVTVKGTVSGTMTNNMGEFRLRTKTKLPFTLIPCLIFMRKMPSMVFAYW